MSPFFFFPLLLAIYLLLMFFRFGMTRSISDTYRKLKGWEVTWFTLALWLGVAFPIIILGLQAAEGNAFQFLWFFAGAGIAFVGAAPVFWNPDIQQKVHVAGATGGIACAILAIALTLPGWWNWLLAGTYLLFALTQTVKKWNFKIKNNTYWLEVAALVEVWLALFINSKM